ncbi:hypothetical protein LSH36_458g02021 [Paralvinella palmiformis]|uniref:Uncharacterized protein n=1 Tax=Paralvinella palmiformis TaxID=53620 RepID=A0AAD9MZB2_9ANNE|nr:hypothetical protein LSH36_458g02021 [Paralvinella palmiformis]
MRTRLVFIIHMSVLYLGHPTLVEYRANGTEIRHYYCCCCWETLSLADSDTRQGSGRTDETCQHRTWGNHSKDEAWPNLTAEPQSSAVISDEMDDNSGAIYSPGTTKRRHLAEARDSVSEPPLKTPAITGQHEQGQVVASGTSPTSSMEPSKNTLYVPEEYFAYRQERRRSSTADIPDLSAVCLSSDDTPSSPTLEDQDRRCSLRRSKSFDGYDPVEECQWRMDTQAMIFVSNPDLREDELCRLAHFHHLRRQRRNAVCYDHLEPLLPITTPIGALKIGSLT